MAIRTTRVNTIGSSVATSYMSSTSQLYKRQYNDRSLPLYPGGTVNLTPSTYNRIFTFQFNNIFS